MDTALGKHEREEHQSRDFYISWLGHSFFIRARPLAVFTSDSCSVIPCLNGSESAANNSSKLSQSSFIVQEELRQ